MAECYIRVKTEEQLKAVLEWGRWNALIIDSTLIGGSCTDLLLSDEREIYIDLPDVARESKAEKIRKIIEESRRFTGIIIKNIDELGMIIEACYKGQVIGDSFLYAFNNDALDQYLELISDMMFIASDELTDREAEELDHRERMIRKIYGHQQLMITAQCLSRNYSGCREKSLKFKDEKGNIFYSLSSCDQCYSVIYNGCPTSMLDKEYGTEPFLLDFTVEKGEQVKSILAGEEIRTFTRGHHNKGID